MKAISTLGALALVASSSAMADAFLGEASTGLVTLPVGYVAQVHVVNRAPLNSCAFVLRFEQFDAGGFVPVSPEAEFDVSGGGSASFMYPDPAITTGSPVRVALRAVIDFTPQVLAHAANFDPLASCYRLAATFEVVDLAGVPQVLDTAFYGLPERSEDGIPHPVVICHKPGTPAKQTMVVPASALFGHTQHGDTLGNCGP